MSDSEISRIGSKLVKDAVIANELRSANLRLLSTAIRTQAGRYDALPNFAGIRIAEEFLINSRLRRGDAESAISAAGYFTPDAVVMLSMLGWEGKRGSQMFVLPESIALEMALGDVIQRRRSVRTYSGTHMPLAYLATLLRSACGITGRDIPNGEISGFVRRSAPSGGGLYPIDIHLAALSVDGLPRGLFLYDVRRDVLWQTGEIETANAVIAALALPGQVIMETHASAIFLLVGRPWRSMRKYGHRGMRYVFLEAGAIAENINLAAVALGVGSVNCESFYDDEVHEAIEIDGLYEALMHSIFVGMQE